MNQITLTREEISLIISSIQRTMITIEKWDDTHSEIVRRHRVLLKTLLDMEKDIHDSTKKIVKPETYK